VGCYSTCTIIIALYVDDIAVTGDDYLCIVHFKIYLSSHFHMKNPTLKAFSLIEVAKSLKVILLFPQKYHTELLE